MKNVVIIGAGIVGCSIAHQLAKSGANVIVVDKAAQVGHGSTSASSGVVRFNYSTLDSIALAWESHFAWRDWAKHLDARSDEQLATFHRVGMLLMDVPVLSLTRSAELFEQAGIPHRIVDAAAIEELIPGIDTGRYWPNKRVDDPEFWEPASREITGMYTPDGGYVDDPALAAQNLAAAAVRHGASFMLRSQVVSIVRDSVRVTGVELSDGSILEADVIVNAAGPWSSKVNELAGVGSEFTVTLAPMRQEVHHVAAPHNYGSAPVVGDLDLGTYFRPEGNGSLLIGGTEPECDVLEWVDDPDDVLMTPTQRQFQAQVTRAARRLPMLGVPGAPRGVVGVYDVSSDWSPIYDKTELNGFYLAAGTSGNQFKNGPVIGQVMNHIIQAVEAGHDHDRQPLQYMGTRSGLTINLGAFSRRRKRNADSTGTVMG